MNFPAPPCFLCWAVHTRLVLPPSRAHVYSPDFSVDILNDNVLHGTRTVGAWSNWSHTWSHRDRGGTSDWEADVKH